MPGADAGRVVSSCPANYPRVGAREGVSSAREHQGAAAAGVAGHAANRHVDAVAGHGPVLFGFPAPEAVLPVLPRPGLARLEDGADEAQLAGLGFPAGPRLGALARGGEEEVGLPAAGCDRLPAGTRRVLIADIDDKFRSERRGHGGGPFRRMRIPDVDNFLTTSEIGAMRQPDRSDRLRR